MFQLIVLLALSVNACTDLCPPNGGWFQTGEECFCAPPPEFTACREQPGASVSECIREHNLSAINADSIEKTGCNVFCGDWISLGGRCFCEGQKTLITETCGENVTNACIAESGAVSAGSSDSTGTATQTNATEPDQDIVQVSEPDSTQRENSTKVERVTPVSGTKTTEKEEDKDTSDGFKLVTGVLVFVCIGVLF